MFGRVGERREKHIAVEHLSAYLDGQVTAQERRQVEQHLATCAACGRELETLRYTTRLLRAMPPVSVPRAFTLAEAEVGYAAARRRMTWLARTLQGAAALVAALLLAVLVGDFLWQPGRFAAPQQVALEKTVRETIVVEAAPEAELEVREETAVAKKVVEVEKPVEVQKAVAVTVEVEREAVVERAAPAAPPAEAAIAEAEGAPAVEGPAEPPMRAMAATAEETPPLPEAPPEAGVGEGMVEPTLGVWMTPETVEEAAPDAMTESVSLAPTAVPAEIAALPTYTPTAVPTPQVTPPLPAETAAQPVARWSLTRPLEIILATLLVILLGLTLCLRRWR